jgi:hypothetical protein
MPYKIFPKGRRKDLINSQFVNSQFSSDGNWDAERKRDSAQPHKLRIDNWSDSLWLLFFLCLIFPSCTQQMADQPGYAPLQASDFFANGSSARPLPVGVIPHDFVTRDELLDTGMINGKPATRFPFPVDRALMLRGRQRYNIYCSPCHDYLGTGNGIVARRGFKRMPASFQSVELRSAPDGHFFDVMTNGFGAMPPYANQIPVHDRWAITAYIRALQFSQAASINDVPVDERQRLETEKQK